MKKLRAIAIKNPKLIKIRNNLRKIWIQALIEQQEKIMVEKCSFMLYDWEFNKMYQNTPYKELNILFFVLENFVFKTYNVLKSRDYHNLPS